MSSIASRLAPALLLASIASTARAEDLSAIVAKARDQIENGSYADAIRTLAGLKGKELPPALEVEASLLETTAVVVTETPEAGAKACARAIVASKYDPEVARDQSPKVREVCRTAATSIRAKRLETEGITVGKLELEDPEVAFQPVRISTTADKPPAWLKVVARIKASGLEGTFDLPLIPSDEGPLLGTLDPSWLRPKAKLDVALVAQDAFGDLGEPLDHHEFTVPSAESMVEIPDVPSDAVVTLDDATVKPDAHGRIPTTAGKHEVTLTIPSGASASSDVETKRGGVLRVALTPQESSPSRVLPWISTGLALALAATGTGLLINAESRRSELIDAAAAREPGTNLPATEYADLQAIDDERSLFTTAGIGLLIGAGGTAVLATVFWLVPTSKKGPAKEAPKDAPKAASITPIIGPGFAGVAGSF